MDAEQIAEAEPSVSADDSFPTIARWRAIRCTREQALRNRRDGKGDADEQDVDDITDALDRRDRRRSDPHHVVDHGDPGHPAEDGDLALERRRLLAGPVEQLGHSPQ